MAFAALMTSSCADARAEDCAADWTTNAVQFESAIQYDDMQSKANPTVHVLINGKAAKMMLDTGAQAHVLWDASLLDEAPNKDPKQLYAHVASTEGRAVGAGLTDERGNTLHQKFYLIPDSVLREYGYAGILSPHTVAANNVAVIDLEKNCFFTSSSFEIRPDSGFEVHRSSMIQNPYGIMAILVELDGHEIPLLVDTGAAVTGITGALVASKPEGQRSLGGMDMFGAEIPQGDRMRLVDLTINGKSFKSLPVIPRLKIGEIEGIVDGDAEGLENYGFIGMDVLKNHVLYFDVTRNEFGLLSRVMVN